VFKETDDLLILLLISLLFISSLFHVHVKPIKFKGFGWYGYLADEEVNENSLELIKSLGGNAVAISVYYEYDPVTNEFFLLSNMTRVKENIELAQKRGLSVLLFPHVNKIGGAYLANEVKKPERYLKKAKQISISLARFAEENNVEMYAVWNEMGLSLLRVENSTSLVNEWLQDVLMEVKKVYKGSVITKEGVQLGLYMNYNYTGFDYLGFTFYPFTNSCYVDPSINKSFCGVNDLKEYEEIVEEALQNISYLKKKFGNKGVILAEIGIDVVNGTFVGNDERSKEIRAKAYEIVLKKGVGIVDGFFFSKFEREEGGCEKLYTVFRKYFR